MTKWMRAGLGTLAWVTTVIGAAGVALHFSPSSSRPFVLAASGATYLMLGALVAIVVFGCLRHRLGAVVAGLVVVLATVAQAPLYFGGADTVDGPAVQVMQTNILFGGADPAAVVAEVRERNVDVLTVDELSPEAVEGLSSAGLDELLPHRYLAPAPGADGTGIWSAYPLTDPLQYDGFVMNQLSATAQVPGIGPVTIYAFHPVPPVFGTQVWADELSRLRDILEQAPAARPAIVGADFNATYDHTQFRAFLSGRFGDAAEQVGAGNLATYPTDKRIPPVVGIDRILVAGGRAVEMQAVDVPGADHRAVVAQIRLDPVSP